jgi:hypothetical protein
MAHIEQAKNEIYFEKNPDAVKLAVKYMYKGLKRDEGLATLIEDFIEVRDEVVKRQIEEAETQYNINKSAKAAKLFGLAYGLDSTQRYPYYMQAKSYIEYEDTATGEPMYKQLLTWYAADLEEGLEDTEKQDDPYLFFIEKYRLLKQFDSARYFISTARKHFEDNAKINFFHKQVTFDQIKAMPPSSLMLDYVQDILAYDPTDEDLLHKENSIYIYLIKIVSPIIILHKPIR